VYTNALQVDGDPQHEVSCGITRQGQGEAARMKASMEKVVVAGICAMAVVISANAQSKTYDVGTEGFIRNWLNLKPIPIETNIGANTEDVLKPVFDKEYVPGQKMPKPSDGDKVKVGDKEFTWKTVEAQGTNIDFEPIENAMNVIVAYVVCDQDISDVVLSIGSDDSAMWTLNGTEVIRAYASRGSVPDEDRSQPVALKKGMNTLVGTIINGVGPSAACARFMDKDNNPVKNIKISLVPGADMVPMAAPAAVPAAAPVVAAPATAPAETPAAAPVTAAPVETPAAK